MKNMTLHSAAMVAASIALVLASGCGRGDGGSATIPSSSVAHREASHPRFDSLMIRAEAEQWHLKPVGEIIQHVGLHFVGTPYEAGLLDRLPEETLVASFDGFDCVLLVETALAAARGIRDQDYRYERFLDELRSLRYRSGVLNGYCSRLHYFSEWIHDNETRGAVLNITEELGGEPLEKRLDFMSSHRSSYPRMADNDSLFAGIVEMESSIADLELFYIPQDRIESAYDGLRAGDIIATATSVGGLDVSHSGLVYRDGEGVGFLHASTAGGVMVSPDLRRYVQDIDIQIGIVVARPL